MGMEMVIREREDMRWDGLMEKRMYLTFCGAYFVQYGEPRSN